MIHLQLWSDGYSDIPVIGPLFLAQGIGSIVLAVALAAFRRLALLAVGAVVAAATAAGLLLTAGTGLFGGTVSLSVPYADAVPRRGVHHRGGARGGRGLLALAAPLLRRRS